MVNGEPTAASLKMSFPAFRIISNVVLSSLNYKESNFITLKSYRWDNVCMNSYGEWGNAKEYLVTILANKASIAV